MVIATEEFEFHAGWYEVFLKSIGPRGGKTAALKALADRLLIAENTALKSALAKISRKAKVWQDEDGNAGCFFCNAEVEVSEEISMNSNDFDRDIWPLLKHDEDCAMVISLDAPTLSWIAAADRLPGDCQRVVGYHPNWGRFFAAYRDGKWITDLPFEADTPSHWYPEPELLPGEDDRRLRVAPKDLNWPGPAVTDIEGPIFGKEEAHGGTSASGSGPTVQGPRSDAPDGRPASNAG